MYFDTPTETLDVTGESCPIPVVKTKQAVDDLARGALLEVHATDVGSVSDIDGWQAVHRASNWLTSPSTHTTMKQSTFTGCASNEISTPIPG